MRKRFFLFAFALLCVAGLSAQVKPHDGLTLEMTDGSVYYLFTGVENVKHNSDGTGIIVRVNGIDKKYAYSKISKMTFGNLEKLTVNDGESYREAAGKQLSEVHYLRSFAAVWNSWCMPFDVKLSELTACGLQAAAPTSIDGENLNIAYMKGDAVLLAGKPYFVKPVSTGQASADIAVSDVTLQSSGSAETVNIGGFDFVGTYEAVTFPTEDGNKYLVLIQKDGNSIIAKSSTNGQKPMRWYLKTPASSGAKLSICIADDDEPTGIKTIDNEQLTIDNARVYNCQGVRVNENYKGVVIMNGKKYLNK